MATRRIALYHNSYLIFKGHSERFGGFERAENGKKRQPTRIGRDLAALYETKNEMINFRLSDSDRRFDCRAYEKLESPPAVTVETGFKQVRTWYRRIRNEVSFEDK